jgi:hypothetical protein
MNLLIGVDNMFDTEDYFIIGCTLVCVFIYMQFIGF